MGKETQAPEIPAEQTETRPQPPKYDEARWDEAAWPVEPEEATHAA